MLPCALRPRTVARYQRTPFSRVITRKPDGSATTTAAAFRTSGDDASLTAACIVVSSSVVERRETGMPESRRDFAAASPATQPAFMSAVPRPYRKSPSHDPDSRVHPEPRGTVSRWPLKRTPPRPLEATTALTSRWTEGRRPSSSIEAVAAGGVSCISGFGGGGAAVNSGGLLP